jgi:arginine decarboxylase
MKPVNTFDLESHRLELWQKIYKNIISEDYQSLCANFPEIFKIEQYWAYPGKEVLFQLSYYLSQENWAGFKLLCGNLLNSLKKKTYRTQVFIPFYTNLNNLDKPQSHLLACSYSKEELNRTLKPYFEVLIVHPNPIDYELLYRNSLATFKSSQDPFLYDFLMVDNYHDAIIAILSNPNIQACIFLPDFRLQSLDEPDYLQQMFLPFFHEIPESIPELAIALKNHISKLRPQLDHYYLLEEFATEEQHKSFERIIYTQSPNLFADIHRHIVSGIEQRYSTPFFDALRSYAKRPKGTFHALPISQGQSIKSSRWINDIVDFYGNGIFAAETSSTLGGMDSIMDPKGSISQAQNKAAKVFLAQKTFFVTNGTTTANKIVMMANLHPEDIVLVSSDCHKSIPYSVFLSGATPIFLETYPLNQYDLYGCVNLKRIKQILLDLKQQNKLHRVKQITLTNSTFDGILYDVQRYMLDILAIKPDIIFHWDEAWFSFGYFNPLYRNKTAMNVAKSLRKMQKDEAYKEFYKEWKSDKNLNDDQYLLNNELYPDPAQLTVRVYATQSIHKTMTAFRQGSMLHIHDQKFSKDYFGEAYRTHTSTSPNYQIIASLDFARRQMSLEGYELVKNSLLLAWQLQQAIKTSPLLDKYFKVLGDEQLVPEVYKTKRPANQDSQLFFSALYQNYKKSLFAVDPTRITLDISATGIDGPNFRQLLMTQYDIQVNKTSHNTILLIINIGVNVDHIQYLLESLKHIANSLEKSPDRAIPEKYIANLPQTRNYHSRFVVVQSSRKNDFQGVDIRTAYYAGMKSENTEYILLSSEVMKKVAKEIKSVSAGFVIPYPPGFPIIVPGQLITYDLLAYLQNIQIKEIHGYHPEKGLKVFTDNFLSSND